ncbi:MAG: hypothetical protein MJY95_00885 [Bacteroidaceae bacterium]|nr:hypothetical protein [Bacteroidaceae bacterium]
MKKSKLLTLSLLSLFCSGVWGQSGNLLAGWDGGERNDSPSNFGWSSSKGKTFNGLNAGSGMRITTTYSNYKLEDGTGYSYDSSSDLSSRIFWIRYNDKDETFTYTFTGLQPGQWYAYSALVGWHNNNNAPTVTAKILAGDKELTSVSKYIGNKTTLYATSSVFKVPADVSQTDEISLTFAADRTGDCMVALSALNLAEIEMPDAHVDINPDARYNIILKYDGWKYDNMAVTYDAGGRTDAGNYSVSYLHEANANYPQAFRFTAVDGADNQYLLSQIDADGKERYICTGVPYGGNALQIRTTTEKDSALVVEVARVTASDGQWNLWNTAANKFIGSQDAGFYTVNSHIDFEIVEANEIPGPSVTAAGYATYMAPIDVEVPSGVKAYSCDAVDGETLTLTEVETTIPANTPVILEAAGGYSAATVGYSNVKPDVKPELDEVTKGYLVGSYVETKAPEGSYVLQNLSEGVKFYKVTSEDGHLLKANHSYLNIPATSNVKAFAFEGTTGIIDVVPVLGNNSQAFNLAGQRVGDEFKGIVIKNGKKQLNK